MRPRSATGIEELLHLHVLGVDLYGLAELDHVEHGRGPSAPILLSCFGPGPRPWRIWPVRCPPFRAHEFLRTRTLDLETGFQLAGTIMRVASHWRFPAICFAFQPFSWFM